MTKNGIITYTIKNADSKRELIAGLMLDNIKEQIDTYDALGEHETLICITSIKPAKFLLNNIYDILVKLFNNIDESIYFKSKISILISFDNTICEILCRSFKGKYIISKYMNGRLIG